MFLFCLVFALFCARLFICALWSPAGKGLTSWLSFVVSSVSLSLSHWYPGSGVVLDCIDSWSLHHYFLLVLIILVCSYLVGLEAWYGVWGFILFHTLVCEQLSVWGDCTDAVSSEPWYLYRMIGTKIVCYYGLYYMGHVVKKPVSVVSHKACFKPVSLYTETS